MSRAINAILSLTDRFSSPLQRAARGLNHFERDARETTSAVVEMANRTKEAFNSMAKGVAAAGAAVGGVSLASAINIDEENRKLQAQLGKTTEEMEGIKAASADVFKTGMVEDISEANRMMLELNRTMGDLSQQELGDLGVRQAVLNMTYDMDTAEATRATDTMTKNFGVSASEAMDYIGWGMQNNLDFSGEFLDTLNEYGPQFRDAGFSAQEMFAILKAGADGGAWNLDKVGDAAKEFGLRIKDGSTTTADAMAELSAGTQSVFRDMLSGSASTIDVMNSVIAELSQMDDQVQAFQIAQGLFGTMSEDLTMDVLYNLQSIGVEAIDVTGTIDQMANTLQGAVAIKLKSALNTGKLAVADFGQEILSMAMPAIDVFVGGVAKVSDWFVNLDDGTKRIIATFGIAAVAAVPVVGIIGKIGGAFTTMARGAAAAGRTFSFLTTLSVRGRAAATALKVLSMGLGAIKIAVMANPLGILAAGITAAAVGFTIAYQKSEVFREKVNDLWGKTQEFGQGLKAQTMPILQNFSDFFQSDVMPVVKNFGELLGIVWNDLLKPFSIFIGQTFIGAFKTAFPTIKTIVSGTFGIVCSMVKNGIGVLKGLTDFLLGIFTGDWEKAGEGIQNAAQFMGEGIKGLVGGLLNTFGEVFPTLKDLAADAFGFISVVIDTGVGVFKGVTDFLLGAFTGDWSKAWNGIKNITKSIWDGVKKIVSGTVDHIVGGLDKIKNGILGILGLKEENGAKTQKSVGVSKYITNGTTTDTTKKDAGVSLLKNKAASTAMKTTQTSIPKHATGTPFFQGGPTIINEGGRGELVNLPSGSQIIPHDLSKKQQKPEIKIEIPVTIQGNVIGNEQYAHYLGGVIAKRVIAAVNNC